MARYFDKKDFTKLCIKRISMMSDMECGVVETLDDTERHKFKMTFKRTEEKIGKYLVTLVDNFVRHPHFKDYKYLVKQDLISYGYEKLWVKLDNFDPTLGLSPLAYFTEVLKRGFWNEMRCHYKRNGREIALDSVPNMKRIT